MLLEAEVNWYSLLQDLCAKLDTLERQSFEDIFPGYLVSAGDCYFPTLIRVPADTRKLTIKLLGHEAQCLTFSKVSIFGTVGENEELIDLAEEAKCSQSSFFQHLQDAQKGVDGGRFGNNIHTDLEHNPWWCAEFSDHVKPSVLYLYRTVDWNIVHQRSLHIVAETRSGDVTLYDPEGDPDFLASAKENIRGAVRALSTLRSHVPEEKLADFDAALMKAANLFENHIAAQKRHSGLGHFIGFLGIGNNQGNSVEQSAIRCQSIANCFLEATSLAVQGHVDFGDTKETALEISIEPTRVSQLRFRTYGFLPPGLGGAELFNEMGDVIHRIEKKQLGLRYRPEGFISEETYKLDLISQICSRVVRLPEAMDVSTIKVWNQNLQHASNTIFLEVSGRNDDGKWTVLYDNASVFKLSLKVLKLADYLLKDQWTSAYAKLIGMLATVYRRRSLMGPIAKLTRNNPVLNDAVFAGSNAVSMTVKYASPLKLGKHGLNVPIYYRDHKEVMGYLTELRDKMISTGLKPFLLYGTLLGAIREKDFIPHDDDLDLAVIVEGATPDDLAEEKQKIVDLLNGVDVKASLANTSAPLIHCHRGPITIDIFVLGHVGETIYWPHKALEVVPERADIFLPLGQLEFKGEVFDVPKDPEAVCEARYGSSWKTPIQSFEW